MQDHHKLRVWHKVMDPAVHAYRVTDSFPEFGSSDQMQRFAVSVASNIAKVSGRGSDREFVRFLPNAFGSAGELETQALIAGRVQRGSSPELSELVAAIDEARRMLNSLVQRISIEPR